MYVYSVSLKIIFVKISETPLAYGVTGKTHRQILFSICYVICYTLIPSKTLALFPKLINAQKY